VEALAAGIREHGIPLLLTAETLEAARHAADQGLIARDALDAIREGRAKDERGELREGHVAPAHD
jgi:hypothetical protein